MSRKTKPYIFLLVTFLMISLLGCFTALASNDLTVSSDCTLTSKFNNYDNVTVKAGKILTLAKRVGEPVGLEVGKSLVVEKGAKITGDGILIFHRGATFSGIPLYYKINGELVQIPKGMQLDRVNSDADDYKPTFYFDDNKKVYVLQNEFHGGDPFQLSLSERYITVLKKEKFSLSLSGLTEGVKWTSSDKTIASVNKSGVITAKKVGNVVITASFEGKEYTCEAEVVNEGLNFEQITMDPGTEFYLQVYGKTVKSVSSSKKKVAKINKKLKVTAIGSGDCKVTITCTDGTKYKCMVHVA